MTPIFKFMVMGSTPILLVLSDESVFSHVVLARVGQDEGGHLPGVVDLGVLPPGPAWLDWLVVEVPAEN